MYICVCVWLCVHKYFWFSAVCIYERVFAVIADPEMQLTAAVVVADYAIILQHCCLQVQLERMEVLQIAHWRLALVQDRVRGTSNCTPQPQPIQRLHCFVVPHPLSRR